MSLECWLPFPQDKAVDGALLKAAAGLWQAKGSQGAWLQQQVCVGAQGGQGAGGTAT